MRKENKAKTKSAHRYKIALVSIILLLMSVAIFNVFILKSDVKVISINENIKISAEVADNGQERAQGLSGRNAIGARQGLLFVFDPKEEAGVWMKDMNFDIDVIWLNKQKEVVTIKENLSPDTYPQVFYPTEPAIYMLEVQAGFVAEHNIILGDTFEF